ncbi:hypothetical protein EC957_011686 [Mortierella hygrophila]|uniref:Uncharacterized protein n=1 Tax=Mortierella hygrophila TaxID=979708 RepID=A0A9P6F949_9FUNG|nr:hypothetical protein EC957_011686 [Mortierella hygrophila]
MAYIRTPTDSQVRYRHQCRSSPRCIVVALSASFIAFNWIVFHAFKGQSSSDYSSDPLSTDSSGKPLPTNWLDTATERSRGYRASKDWQGQWYRWRALNPSKIEQQTDDLTKFDIVYTWVNGSDPLFQTMRLDSQNNHPMFQKSLRENAKQIDSTTKRRYRDTDELRYSLRSTFDYASDLFRHIHIVTAEVAPNQPQTPSWLIRKPDSPIQIVSHKTIFPNSSHLPSYNSLAIESQFLNIPDLTDIFMYMNDDIFLGLKLLPSDLWTPLYGYVLHMEASLLVPPTVRYFDPNAISVGEWHSLQYSNYLLSQRFGPRHRAYIAHVIHVLSVSMLKEILSLWPDDMEMTNSHQFRSVGEGKDIHVSFFTGHYIMEKLRETQLESFWQYRLDTNQDGILDWEERKRLIDRIKIWNVNQDQVTSDRRQHSRPTMIHAHKATLDRIGIRMSGTTLYRKSGLDGYPYLLRNADTSKTIPTTTVKDKDGKDVLPQLPYRNYEPVKDRKCKLDVDFCFGPDFVDSTYPRIPAEQTKQIFSRMAFKEFHCGDCLLEILMQDPYRGGMGAWMPEDETSHAFASVVEKVARYNYVLGTSDYSFMALQGAKGAKKDLDILLAKWDQKAFFCINDDFPDDPVVENEIQTLFRDFLNTRFRLPSPYETVE